MKISLKLAALFAAIVSVSCSSDSSSGTKLRYVIHADSPIITNIAYKKANGSTATVTDQGGPDWEQVVKVSKPFDATMTVSFDNVASTTSDYYLAIYVNDSGDPAAYVPGIVPPHAINSGTVSYHLN